MITALTRLDPRRFVAVLREIHADSPAAPRHWDPRVAIVLITVAVCLLMLHYLKYRSTFLVGLDWLEGWVGAGRGELTRIPGRHPYGELISHAWWGFWHVICYVVIPVIVARVWLRDRIHDYGLGLGELRQHWGWYVLLAAPILSFVVMASFRQDFVTYYPFYDLAHRSWFDLLCWEAIYLLQFVCLEFFFRGFFVQALRPSIGANAVFVMVVPYLMIHFPKPWLEATGAILFGLFLGVLALRSRSIWGGVGVHVAIAAAMDIAALIQGPGLPTVWMR